MTCADQLGQTHVRKIAQQIIAIKPDGTTLRDLPGSPFHPGRLRRFGAAVVSSLSVGGIVAWLSLTVTLILWWLSERKEAEGNGLWTSFQGWSLTDFLMLFPILAVLIVVGAYAVLRRFSDLRYLKWTTLMAFAVVMVLPLLVIYPTLDAPWVIYLLIGLYGIIFYGVGAVVANGVFTSTGQASRVWGRGTGANWLAFLIIALLAVAWGILFAEGTGGLIGWVESVTAVQGNTPPETTPGLGPNAAREGVENQSNDRNATAVESLRHTVVALAFILWTVWTLIFLYVRYLRFKLALRERSDAAASSIHLIERALGRVPSDYRFQGDDRKRIKMLRKCGDRLGSKTLKSRIGFLAASAVASAYDPQDHTREKTTLTNNLTRDALTRGITGSVEHLVDDQRDRTSEYAISPMLSDLHQVHQSFVFYEVVFALAGSVSPLVDSTPDPENGPLPQHSAKATHLLADEIAQAICNSGIGALVAAEYKAVPTAETHPNAFGDQSNQGPPESPATESRPEDGGALRKLARFLKQKAPRRRGSPQSTCPLSQH